MEASGAANYLISARRCEIRALEHFLLLGRLVSAVSTLVHELQRERGASNLMLASNGASYTSELGALRSITDQQINHVDITLTELEQGNAATPRASRFYSQLAYATHLLSTLDVLREKADRRDVSTTEATEIYSAIIQALINIVFETADSALDSVPDPALSRALVGIFNFIQGKELAGQERAAGAAGFAKGGFSETLVNRISHLIDAQSRCFEIFTEFADPGSLNMWSAACSADCHKEINTLRRYAMTQGSNPVLNKSYAERWFIVQTLRIDEMKKVEEALQHNLSQLCQQKLLEAREGLDNNRLLIQSLSSHQPVTEDPFVLVRAGAMASVTNGTDSTVRSRSLLELLHNQAQRLHSMENELNAARSALEERKIIDRAKVKLMKDRSLTEDQAHQLMRQMAMNQSRKLIDIARMLINI